MDRKFVVTADNHTHQGTPISVLLDGPEGTRSIELVDSTTHHPVPCQSEVGEGGMLVSWIESGLAKGATKTFPASLSYQPRRPQGEDSVRLQLRSADRLDVRIQGDLFTSYYFGSQWHRPYFHPVTGPHGVPVIGSMGTSISPTL